jgi:hypothetical protein
MNELIELDVPPLGQARDYVDSPLPTVPGRRLLPRYRRPADREGGTRTGLP